MALSFTGDFTEPKFQVGTGSFCLVLNKLVDSSRPFCSAMPTKSLTPLPFPSFQTLYFVVLPTRQQDSSICQSTTLNTTAQLSPPPWLSLQRQAVQQGAYNTGHSSLLVSSLLPTLYLFWVIFLIS